MYPERLELYRKIEAHYQAKLLVYITGDRQNATTMVGSDVIDLFINHLNQMHPTSRIALYLYTAGGHTAAAWNIINLIRQYCDNFQVLIPRKAHSAGTLISIGANSITMTKEATLSPIDPTINTPLNPTIQTAQGLQPAPVSVESINAYIDFAREDLGVADPTRILEILSEKVHPLVLGNAYRTRGQIRMLAEKLLKHQAIDHGKTHEIINFLCADSGSHDYTLNRREAKDLGLNVVKPDEYEYELINSLFMDINAELNMYTPFIGGAEGAVKAALLESVYGADYFNLNTQRWE